VSQSSTEILMPPSVLVALVGPAGAGKSTFAAANFRPSEVLSSDQCRLLVADDEADQSASAAAFAVLYFIAARRARRGRLTVIDATNVRRADRQRLLWLADRYKRPPIAILFALPLELCLARNQARVGRQVEPAVVQEQWSQLPASAEVLVEEGFSVVYTFHGGGDAGAARVARSET
jgi:protein phosphatase